ncbi:MAG: hypothetical protein QOJ85_1703 [Solirubrobacteraceae bacterium]|jgi:hypothetical protein|nr:hypothetical protein [Solirubrobacteraceae bacterium]MEA2244398.1 hypothetical protein [Solirubrobacteraceae bacterium]
MGIVERKSRPPDALAASSALALQCVTSIAGTLIGEALGRNLPEKLIAGVLIAVVGAFLTAPGKHHRRRIVAVTLLLALLEMLRRALRALASTGPDHRRPRPASHASTPSSWSAVALTAVAGFGLGSLGIFVLPDGTDTSASTRLTISASSRRHDFTQAITISGRVANHKSGIPVTLHATMFPYGTYRTIAQTSTRGGGYYRFRTRSDLATRYVTSLSTRSAERSGILTVYTSSHTSVFQCNLCRHVSLTGPTRARTLRISYLTRYPAEVYHGEYAKPVYFYYGQRNDLGRPPPRLRLIKTITRLPIGNNVARVDITHRIFFTRQYTFEAAICTKDTQPINGFGLPGRHHCGQRTITYRQAQGYLG